MLEQYGHGGDLATASERFGLPADAFLDFSSNMNPLGPPAAVHQALLAYGEELPRYPDPVSRRLRNRLADKHGISMDAILVGNGAAELIDLAVRALKPSKMAIAAPCFGEYEDAAKRAGIPVYAGHLRAAADFVLDERWVEEALERSGADLYMLGSPNNPTGACIEPSLIRRLLESGATVVLDEAFLDFVPHVDRMTFVKEASLRGSLFVLRSMTKLYAIPGIRLGYMTGNPQALETMKRLQVPWSVNSLAQAIGCAVLEDEAFMKATWTWLSEESEFVRNGLRRLGCRDYPGNANYVLVRLPEGAPFTSAELQSAMGSRGVLIRDASLFRGLDERYIRVAVKGRADNERLLEALRASLESLGGGCR
ncbi:threonine-phosphate decarboxylase CobD [Paenibacillus sp. PL2-23]|uniref:threonine-phosphate decarboxylase CobD n=1 Tax=Paenibacillus sp. PL2-23 TaxID=2100729 RepID=UPI0030F754D4